MSPTSATHNPLLIQELFQCILDCLDAPKLDTADFYLSQATERELRKARRTLAALARTCRTLSGASLDRLWRRLYSLTPLIRSFSSDADNGRAEVSFFQHYTCVLADGSDECG